MDTHYTPPPLAPTLPALTVAAVDALLQRQRDARDKLRDLRVLAVLNARGIDVRNGLRLALSRDRSRLYGKDRQILYDCYLDADGAQVPLAPPIRFSDRTGEPFNAATDVHP